MPPEKRDATHFLVTQPLGPFPAGATVTREDIYSAIGADPKAEKEAVATHQANRVKRLIALGAIAPTEAPPDPEEVAAKAEADAAKSTERMIAEEEAAARKAKADAEKPGFANPPTHKK